MKDIFKIKYATIEKIKLILAFINDLAEYEKLTDQVATSEHNLKESLFGETPYAKVIID